jgi:hypothetical protein
MADRFYINTTNLVTFAAGERPTADKFNAVNRYFSRGLNSLAKVIGDAHDDGAPHNLNTSIYLTNKWNRSGENERPLDILNLARIIGPASNLNPKYLNRTDHASRMIQETIPAGVLEYYPKFPIDSLGTIILGSEFVSEKGFIRFETNTTEEIQFQYIPKDAELIEGGPNYVDAEFNVIPDPNTPANNPTYSLTIVEEFDGSYTVTLPTVGYQQSKLSDLADSNIDSAEPNNAAQIKLPKWMQDLGVLYNGSTLPEGTIYIKDRTTGESFIDAQYIYLSDTEVKVTGVELCLDEDHDFCLIVSGTDITTTLDDLRNKVFMHKHDGSFGESRISIYDLKDVFKYAPPSGAYKESELTWNAFPQYLHRDGWQEGEDSFNGGNAMRGPLMMGLLDFSTGISNNTGSSNKIFFGGNNTYIQRVGESLTINNSENDVTVLSETYNNISSSSATTIALESISLGIQANSSLNAELNQVSLNGKSHFFKRNDIPQGTDPETYNSILEPLGNNNIEIEIFNKELKGIEGVITEEMPIRRAGATLSNFSLSNELDPTSGIEANYDFTTNGNLGNSYWYCNNFALNNEGLNAGYFSIASAIELIDENGILKSQRQVNALIVKNKLNAYYKYCISKSYTLETGDKIIVWDRFIPGGITDPNPSATIYDPATTTSVKINRGVNLIQLNYSLETMYKSTFFIEIESDYHSGMIDGYVNNSIYSVLSTNHNVNITFDYSDGEIVENSFNSVVVKQVYVDGVNQNVGGNLFSIEISQIPVGQLIKVEENIINGYVFLRIEKI